MVGGKVDTRGIVEDVEQSGTILNADASCTRIKNNRRGQPERMSKLQRAILEDYAMAKDGFLYWGKGPGVRGGRKEESSVRYLTRIFFDNDDNGRAFRFSPVSLSSYYRATQGLERKGFLRRALPRRVRERKWEPWETDGSPPSWGPCGPSRYRGGLELTEKAREYLARTKPLNLDAPGMPWWAKHVADVRRERRGDA